MKELSSIKLRKAYSPSSMIMRVWSQNSCWHLFAPQWVQLMKIFDFENLLISKLKSRFKK